MANKDYERMIELGEWLEKFLDQNNKLRDYEKLGFAFIKLYDLHHDISKNEATLEIIKLIEASEPETQKFYKKDLTPISVHRAINDIKDKKDPLKLKENIDRLALCLRSKEDMEPFLESINSEMLSVYQYAEYTKYALQLISEFPGEAWEKILFTQNMMELIAIDGKLSGVPQIIDLLISNYNKLKVNLESNPCDGKISFLTGFECAYKPRGSRGSNSEEPTVFPWSIAASRAFFDFLLLGGQDRIRFCNNCEKFTVVQRKGRKKFCSDICRTAHGNAERAKL